MASDEKISVYVPAHNAAATLRPCLESLLQQKRAAAEILVIDDGSRDDTAAIAESYPVKLLRQPQNAGLAAARNRGLAEAGSPLVAAIDADCRAHGDWLEKLAAAFTRNPRLGVAGGRLEEAVQTTAADRWRKTYMAQHWGDSPIDDPRFVFGHSFMVRKALVEPLGRCPEIFRTNGEDAYMSRLLKRNGVPTTYVPDAVVDHLKEDTTESILNAVWRYNTYGRFSTRLVEDPRAELEIDRRTVWRNFRTELKQARRRVFADLFALRFSLLPIDLKCPFVLLRKDLAFSRNRPRR